MNKEVYLAETAVRSLQEIKFYKREASIRTGMPYAESEEAAQAFVENLMLNSLEQISNERLEWAYDTDMANRGIKVKRYYDAKRDYLCFFDHDTDDIAVLYYASPRQNHTDALYRLLINQPL